MTISFVFLILLKGKALLLVLIDSNKEKVNIKSESGSAGVFIPQKKDREGFTVRCSDENNNLAVEREFFPYCE